MKHWACCGFAFRWFPTATQQHRSSSISSKFTPTDTVFMIGVSYGI